MKKNNFFLKTQKKLLFTLIIIGASCIPEQLSGQQKLDKNTLIDKMAIDDDYIAFLNAAGESAKMIAAGEVDLNAVGRLLSINNITNSFCGINENLIASARGGIEYVRIQCEISNSLNAFKQKFPEYRELLTDEERRQVSIKSKMMHGLDYQGREIGDILLNSNKKQ